MIDPLRDVIGLERERERDQHCGVALRWYMIVIIYSDAGTGSSLNCGHVFTGHVTRWLHVLRHVVLQRVYRAVELDTVCLPA